MYIYNYLFPSWSSVFVSDKNNKSNSFKKEVEHQLRSGGLTMCIYIYIGTYELCDLCVAHETYGHHISHNPTMIVYEHLKKHKNIRE